MVANTCTTNRMVFQLQNKNIDLFFSEPPKHFKNLPQKLIPQKMWISHGIGTSISWPSFYGGYKVQSMGTNWLTSNTKGTYEYDMNISGFSGPWDSKHDSHNIWTIWIIFRRILNFWDLAWLSDVTQHLDRTWWPQGDQTTAVDQNPGVKWVWVKSWKVSRQTRWSIDLLFC